MQLSFPTEVHNKFSLTLAGSCPCSSKPQHKHNQSLRCSVTTLSQPPMRLCLFYSPATTLILWDIGQWKEVLGLVEALEATWPLKDWSPYLGPSAPAHPHRGSLIHQGCPCRYSKGLLAFQLLKPRLFFLSSYTHLGPLVKTSASGLQVQPQWSISQRFRVPSP